MEKRIHIIHFQAIELYPPVQNMMNVFSAPSEKGGLTIHTMTPPEGVPKFSSVSAVVRIRRSPGAGKQAGKLRRLQAYLHFYLGTLIELVREHPDTVMYIETLSSFPALAYKAFFNRKARLFIHYHEYETPNEYRDGMLLNRKLHQWEMRFYPSAQWVSHTNQDRLDRFLRDVSPVTVGAPRLLANHPPDAWLDTLPRPFGDPVRLVYCGALGTDSMYLEEIVRWVERMEGRCVLDLYSLVIEDKARKFLQEGGWKWVVLKEPVPYQDLGRIYWQYDVGLILYKGVIANYVFNVPNKLFEYLVCGLDVWFPLEMTSCHPMITDGIFPQVKGLDMKNMDQYELRTLTDRTRLREVRRQYSAGKELAPLKEALFSEPQ